MLIQGQSFVDVSTEPHFIARDRQQFEILGILEELQAQADDSLIDVFIRCIVARCKSP